jgi:cyclopropane fatty-acyl-phospholipid synthase-like methyltransferase
MRIKNNGGWLQNDDGWTGHAYIKSMSDLLLKLVEKHSPSLVYDFGCGWGDYARDISATGVETIGFEAYPDTLHYDNIQELDLSKLHVLDRKADLSISLEVGEHIPAKFEQNFIDNICNNTKDIVVLSWAIEGQAGDGHVNCRNNDYVIDQMSMRGFVFDDSILQIRRDTEDLLWFHDTLMLFKRV